MSPPSADDVITLAKVAGFEIGPDEAARIAGAIGPALERFATVAVGLPFDVEPAHFIVVQNGTDR